MGSYEYYNYEDLEITSTKKPFNTHLFWEHSTYGIFLIDSADQTVLLGSTKARLLVDGSDWDIIDLSDNINSYKIQAGWLDGNDLWLVMCDNDATADDFEVCYIELDDSNDCNPTGVSSSDDAGTVNAIDIFKIGTDHYVYIISERLGDSTLAVWDVDSAFIEKDNWNLDPHEIIDGYFGFVNGVDYFSCVHTWLSSAYHLYTWHYESDTIDIKFDHLIDLYETPTNRSQVGISFNGNDTAYFIATKTSDSKEYLVVYEVTPETHTVSGEYNIALMLDRNTNSSANPPNNLEKGFHISSDKVYQIPSSYSGRLNLISKFNFTDNIIGITDSYIIDDGGKVYEYTDLIDSIFNGIISHSRNDFSHLEMKYNSDDFTISTQQFVQIIGPYTVDGSTTSNQVIFEGIAKKPTKGRIQYVLLENQSSEMDQVQPKGSKAGRTDQIITDINNDGNPNGPEYIRDGTLSAGGAMGTLELEGAKDYREVVNDFAEHDAFLWSLRPQGALDYNNGSVDSGADIRFDGSTYTDVILQLKSWTIAKLNQIIVNGAINTSTGIPYTGQWDDEDDQQENGINSVTIEDAQLNTDALCQSKADTMGGNESERTRARFKFRKTTYGFIQPGQTITFKYDISNYITISEAQFIVDKMIINIKSEVGYMEISSGL